MNLFPNSQKYMRAVTINCESTWPGLIKLDFNVNANQFCSSSNLGFMLHQYCVILNLVWDCHATDGRPTTGPAGPSMANFVAIDGPAGLSMAAMDS